MVWQWPEGVERRYMASAQIDLPIVVEFDAPVNTDAQITGFNLVLLLRCGLDAPIGRSAFAVRCDIDDASLQVEPVTSSRGRVAPIAEEWARILRDDAWIQVEMTNAGRVRNVDLEGVDKRVQRLQVIGETMRLFVARALAPLDVALPRKGTDNGLGQWVQPASNINALPRPDGSVGTMVVVHQLSRTDGSSVFWSFHGDGSLASADDAQSTARFSFTTTADGSAIFDTASGTLIESQLLAEGRSTASSINTSSGGNQQYRQASYIRLLAPDAPAPTLPRSGQIE